LRFDARELEAEHAEACAIRGIVREAAGSRRLQAVEELSALDVVGRDEVHDGVGALGAAMRIATSHPSPYVEPVTRTTFRFCDCVPADLRIERTGHGDKAQ
jgi:hypothetical protein